MLFDSSMIISAEIIHHLLKKLSKSFMVEMLDEFPNVTQFMNINIKGKPGKVK